MYIIEQIIFTIITFVLFLYILLLKLVKKNDTTYLIILAVQAIGILVNLVRITTSYLRDVFSTSFLCLTCIVLPIAVFVLEMKHINVSEILSISLAKIYLLFNNTKRAKKVLIELVIKYKDSYLGHKMLAHIYEKDGGIRKAIDEYVKVLDIKKSDYKSYYKISTLLNELGKKDEAAEMLENLLKNKPEIYEASKMLGEIYLEKQNFKKTIEIYTNALKYQPENYEIYYIIGICYARINDFDIARKCFQKVTELNEDMYNAYYKLGQIALLYRDFDCAENNFSKSLYKEKEAKSYFELAKINVIKNQKEKAVMNLNNAIKSDSELYNRIKEEPMFFSIKNMIQKPTEETANNYQESKMEKEIEEYLNDTYNLTKILQGKEEKNKHKKRKNI